MNNKLIVKSHITTSILSVVYKYNVKVLLLKQFGIECSFLEEEVIYRNNVCVGNKNGNKIHFEVQDEYVIGDTPIFFIFYHQHMFYWCKLFADTNVSNGVLQIIVYYG